MSSKKHKKSKSKDDDKKKKKKSKSSSKSSKSSSKSKKSKRSRKPLEITPVKEKFTKSGLIAFLETKSGVEKRQCKKVYLALESIMLGSVAKKGRGEFMWPGLFKMVVKDIPAKKGGEKKRNPFNGEMMVTKAKPATRKVKIRPMSKAKQAALA